MRNTIFLKALFTLAVLSFSVQAMNSPREEEGSEGSFSPSPSRLARAQRTTPPEPEVLRIDYSENGYTIETNPLDIQGVQAHLERTNPKIIIVAWTGEDAEEDLPHEVIVARRTTLNNVLERLPALEGLTELTLSRQLNQTSINLVGRLVGLRRLNFLENDAAMCEMVISSKRFNAWSSLAHLRELNLRATSFAKEDFSSKFEEQRGADIKFYTFLQILPHLTSLRILDVGNNSLFPEVQKSTKNNKSTLSPYMEWRARQIEACALMLAEHFQGEELLMADTHLGDLFLGAFERNLSSFGPQNRVKLDFSKNYVSLSTASRFVIALEDLPFESTALFEGNQDDTFRTKRNKDGVYTIDDLKSDILERLLTRVSLSE